jgi:PIN domain nuclease of toxin-antitoxin system
MALKFVVDTHALIWYLEGNPRLGTGAKAVMDDATSELVLPIIALAEAAYIVERGRTSIPSTALLVQRVQADPRIVVYPLTLQVLERSLSLTAIPEMHDRLIVATAVDLVASGHTVGVLTRDGTITSLKTVPVVW